MAGFGRAQLRTSDTMGREGEADAQVDARTRLATFHYAMHRARCSRGDSTMALPSTIPAIA
jgi:hypothetical protein